VDVSVGYSLVQDVGGSVRSGTDALVCDPSGGCAGIFGLAVVPTSQTFPLRYLSPQGRVSLRISEKVRWNAGYQYYGYHQDFSALQNYRAHTGYTSVLWAF